MKTSTVNYAELFAVDPTSVSGLRWLKSGTGRRSDLRVGSPDTPGYWRVNINRKGHMVHRIIWELTHGPIPAGHVIDHINGDPADNRIENLRVAAPQENSRNAAGHTGRFFPKGVYHRGDSNVVGIVEGVTVGFSVSLVTDNSSAKLNDLCEAVHDAILEAHGEFANVSTFYSAVPDEACMGPDTGHN